VGFALFCPVAEAGGVTGCVLFCAGVVWSGFVVVGLFVFWDWGAVDWPLLALPGSCATIVAATSSANRTSKAGLRIQSPPHVLEGEKQLFYSRLPHKTLPLITLMLLIFTDLLLK
jgi:hypothetical protein